MTIPQIPKSIRVRALLDGKPLPMAWFLITLQMTQKKLPDGAERPSG
jgi:hypothetical protein